MATIKPFKALVYNQEKINKLADVVCPPYDVISPLRQDYFHELHPNNFIHILLGKDIDGEDKYVRAGKIFKEWQADNVFVQDAKPTIYFYTQQYKIQGETRTRFGFISLLRLEDKDTSVFKHELTRSAPKEDRLKLLKQVHANLSPIFVVFMDKKKIIQRTYNKVLKNSPASIEVTDEEKTVHKIWRIDSAELLKQFEEAMAKENMFIADGHHRYEVACAYRDQMRRLLGQTQEDESFNYVLSYFTNTDPRGLSILAIHRLIKLDRQLDLKAFIEKLREYFEVEEVKDKAKFFFLMQKGGRSEHMLGVYKDKRYWLLRLKNIRILDKEMKDKPKEYRTLDVSILNQIVFKNILGIEVENKENITYNPDAEEFINRVDKDPSLIAFFLNPVKVQEIIAVALNGERMPAKSTYFYPKVLSGLLINKHEG